MPSKNKKYYQNLIKEHKADLAKARKLISSMLNKLDEEIQEINTPEDNKENYKNNIKFWWGDKESASSILSRLTQLLLKLIPLEQEIAKLDLTKADLSELEEIATKAKIPQEDLDIINNYIQKVKSE